MRLAIIAIGLPGSGKTTLLKPFAEEHGLEYISRDEIREEFFGDPLAQTEKEKVWGEANERAAAALSRGKNVLLDSTFIEPWKRRQIIDFVRASGADRVIGLRFDVDMETAREQNQNRTHVVPDEVIERLYQLFINEPPAESEGFDTIYAHSELDLLKENELGG